MIVAINGSPRKEGNTYQMLREILDAIGEKVETQVIHLQDYRLTPCDACYSCMEKDGECHIKDDVQKILDRMIAAEAIIVGSPVYFGSVTPEVRMLSDRVGFMSQGKLEGKIGLPVTVARRWGHINAMTQIATWFLNLGMIIPGPGNGWCSATAKDIGDLEKDKEGIEMARKAGIKVRELLDRLSS